MRDESLTSIEREQYLAQGYVGPLEAYSPGQTAALLDGVNRVLGTQGMALPAEAEGRGGRLSSILPKTAGRDPFPYIECRHLDSRFVHDICSHPRIAGTVASVLGPDLLLWRSTFIEKAPGGPEFRWHQDFGGVFRRGSPYGIEPPVSCTAWLALTKADRESGCMQFIAGVHTVLPTVPASSDPGASSLVPTELIDESRGIDMVLDPGQFVLFSDRALHRSWPNQSGRRRLAIAIRFTIPAARVRPHFQRHRVVLIRGEDRTGFNILASPPEG